MCRRGRDSCREPQCQVHRHSRQVGNARGRNRRSSASGHDTSSKPAICAKGERRSAMERCHVNCALTTHLTVVTLMRLRISAKPGGRMNENASLANSCKPSKILKSPNSQMLQRFGTAFGPDIQPSKSSERLGGSIVQSRPRTDAKNRIFSSSERFRRSRSSCCSRC